MTDTLQWTSPSPLWTAAARIDDPTLRRGTLLRPTLLRFASDSFMDDFMQLMSDDPPRLSEFVAKPETWRGPISDPPLAPVQSLPALARQLTRLSLNRARQNTVMPTPVSNQIGTLATGLTLSGTAFTGSVSIEPPVPLKLYQPAHQRYYLVAAHLVCGRTGLPDHVLNAARQERVSFVLRRLLPPGVIDPNTTLPPFNQATWEEYAFVLSGKTGSWQRIPRQDAANLIKGEEKLPLFPVNFVDDEAHNRRLFAGLVPVGRREAYMAAPQRVQSGDPQLANPPKTADPRMMLFWSLVTEPWLRLLERADAAQQMQQVQPNPLTTDEPLPTNADPTLDPRRRSLKATREQTQTVSWYILLDFAKLLEQYMPNVWASLIGQQLPDPPLSSGESALLVAFEQTLMPLNLSTELQNSSYPSNRIAGSLRSALIAMNGGSTLDGRTKEAIATGLETIIKSYDRDAPDPLWPRFLFPVADSEFTAPLPPKDPNIPDDSQPLVKATQRVNNLARLIEEASRPLDQEATPATGLAGQPVLDMRQGWFSIRCVFERPECGPIDLPLLSEPTRAFQFASFFDPDAPARPIRIALPVDTTPAGLRKFDKNTAFMISDVLCGQINRMKSLGLGDLIRTVLPWPLHKDLSVPDGGACTDANGPQIQVGMICSLSIPIITICALLLLMIIVTLLDIVFRWIPYFLICFPLPGLNAKK